MGKRSKYKNIKTSVDGIVFASGKEANRYSELKLLERAGHISDLELQPKFDLVIDGKPVKIRSKGFPNGRRSSYKADFRYFELRSGKTIVEEVKSAPQYRDRKRGWSYGTDTTASRLRRAVVECIYDIQILLT